MKISNICWILVGLFFIITTMLTIFLHGETKKEIVDCYDKYGNKIIGVTCDKEYQTMPIIFWISLSLIFIFEILALILMMGGI
jgi:hypothetical protein